MKIKKYLVFPIWIVVLLTLVCALVYIFFGSIPGISKTVSIAIFFMPLFLLMLYIINRGKMMIKKGSTGKKEFNLYIGCALTHAPEEFKLKVEILKNKLEENKVCNVLKFIGLTKGTDKDVYDHDINVCVRGCDLLVAICDEASIGLGYELATQVEDRKKPALAVAQVDTHLTRLVTGIRYPYFEFKRYQDFDDLYEIIVEKIKEVKNVEL